MQKVIHSITRMSDFFTLCRPLLILKATKELKILLNDIIILQKKVNKKYLII